MKNQKNVSCFPGQNVYYFLADDCIEVTEVQMTNAGHDPFPVFASKGRVPKVSAQRNPSGKTEYYTDADLAIGNYINVYERKVLL